VNIPGCKIEDKRRWLRAVEPDFIATQLLKEAGQFLFGDLAKSDVLAIPHALNPNAFFPPSLGKPRSIEIGVRTARYLPHLGDNDRNRINDYFAENAADLGLDVDISSARLDRDGWASFLQQCRATVSTEAGSWYLEKDDATVEAVRQYLNHNSDKGYVLRDDSMLAKTYNKLPDWLKRPLRLLKRGGLIQHEFADEVSGDFDEIYVKFFRDLPRAPCYSKCISSRHFDAVGTKTLQIMYDGRFNDILTAGKNFIELADDFGNIDDVLEQIKDTELVQNLVDDTYEYIMAEHTYAHRISRIHDHLTSSI
jgi:hypothetical protein